MTFPENLSNTHRHVGTEEVEDDAALSRCPGEEAVWTRTQRRKAPGERRHHCPQWKEVGSAGPLSSWRSGSPRGTGAVVLGRPRLHRLLINH